jgi:hypothetical protein
MSLKSKLLGLALLASLVAAAFAVMTASANQEGHFVTPGNAQATILGTEKGHTLEWKVDGLGDGIICNDATWEWLSDQETETSLLFDPTLKGCRTTGQQQSFEIKRNTCLFHFYAAKGTTDQTEQTAKLECGSNSLEILHPGCTVTVPSQSVLTGITYTKVTFDKKNAITADFNVKVNVQTDGPVCPKGQKTGQLVGSILFEALNAGGTAPVDLVVT